MKDVPTSSGFRPSRSTSARNDSVDGAEIFKEFASANPITANESEFLRALHLEPYVLSAQNFLTL